MPALGFGDLMGADFGVPTSPTFNQPYSFPSAGAAPAGGFNWGSAAGMMGLANLGLGIMGQSNAARSVQSAYNMAGIMNDYNFGRDLWALNKDIFEQKDAPRWASRFQVNDPGYGQSLALDNLTKLAGKYGGTRFGSFVSR